MAKYITDVDRWLSHENRMVKAGEEFETEFPKGMRLSETLREVKPQKGDKRPEPKADELA
jgi:hypothetical protein